MKLIESERGLVEMELPAWAFKAESRVRRDGAIDMVFRLRPWGRPWLLVCAIVELIRTSTITITIEFQEQRPVVTHDGERIEPTLDYTLDDKEVDDLVKRIPIASLPYFIQLAKDRHLFPTTPVDRK
jgi:hypothetical protein